MARAQAAPSAKRRTLRATPAPDAPWHPGPVSSTKLRQGDQALVIRNDQVVLSQEACRLPSMAAPEVLFRQRAGVWLCHGAGSADGTSAMRLASEASVCAMTQPDPPSAAPRSPSQPADKMPYGIYVHVPYCRRRCPYCDFYFEVRPADGTFASAAIAELTARIGAFLGESTHGLGQSPQSIYFGGGTPTALPDEQLASILEHLRSRFDLSADVEVTVEANPEDLVPGRCARLAAMGINRLSLGVQSLDDDVLRYLGRAHRGAQAVSAVQQAQVEGIERVSVDCIAGVPGEAPDRLRREVDRWAALEVGHISAYLLTLEPETPLAGLVQLGRRRPPDDDQQADAYEELQALLSAAGYRQYEVSSYARRGQESRHNRLYWSKGAYLGLGPGAHSMQLLEEGAVRRRQNRPALDAWLADPVCAPFDEEHLSPAEAFLEAVAFGLRDLGAGVALAALQARHRQPRSPALQAVLRTLCDRGLLRTDGSTWRLTALGARFADGVARDILATDLAIDLTDRAPIDEGSRG